MTKEQLAEWKALAAGIGHAMRGLEHVFLGGLTTRAWRDAGAELRPESRRQTNLSAREVSFLVEGVPALIAEVERLMSGLDDLENQLQVLAKIQDASASTAAILRASVRERCAKAVEAWRVDREAFVMGGPRAFHAELDKIAAAIRALKDE